MESSRLHSPNEASPVSVYDDIKEVHYDYSRLGSWLVGSHSLTARSGDPADILWVSSISCKRVVSC